jgi:probable phosphoglycerate mutase
VIIFVRHGETELNANGALQGRVDTHLTARGRVQAAQLAAALVPAAPVRVVSSPLVRATQTAAVIADACGLDVTVDARLVEIDYGSWDTLSFADVRAVADPAWRSDPAFMPPGGESLDHVVARVGAFCVALASSEGGDEAVTIAVSHVSPIKAAVTSALGVSAIHAWNMHLDVASITRVMWRGDDLVLRSFNETAHLSD